MIASGRHRERAFDPRPILEKAVLERTELDHEVFEIDVGRIDEAWAWVQAHYAQAQSPGGPPWRALWAASRRDLRTCIQASGRSSVASSNLLRRSDGPDAASAARAR